MEFDSTATLGALAKLPPEAPKIAESKGSAWTAPFRAVPAAAAEVLAGGAELLTAGARLADRGGVAGMMQRGESLTSIKGETEVSRSLRNVAESYAPDPATAGTAERLVFGLTRGVGKAVGYGLTTGPAAPFLFGADEGLTQMDALQRQGVDTGTAMQAGGVAAAVNMAGFLIPVAGKTVAGTIGLGTLSGPASFVAQQAATREILARADYGKIAEQFDPLDPVGLGASLLPFGFGAWAMRGKIKGARPVAEPARPAAITSPADSAVIADPARPPPAAAPVGDTASPVARPEVAQEHVDAAMVHNLTLFEDAVRQAPPVDAPPIQVFHGTKADIASVDQIAATVDIGPHFTTARKTAEMFANDGGTPGRVLEGFARFDAPLRIPDLGMWFPSDVAKAVDEARGIPAGADDQTPMQARVWSAMEEARIAAMDALPEEFQAVRGKFAGLTADQRATLNAGMKQATDAANKAGYEMVRAELRALGYDSIVYANTHEGDPVDTFIALNPGQVQATEAALARPPEVQPPATTSKAAPADVPQPAQSEPQASPQTQPQAAAQGSGPAATAAREAGAVAQALRTRADQVATEAPDLVVGLTEDGQPITARQELERIRREAMEGTDDTLGGDDAKLVDVAVACALSQGE